MILTGGSARKARSLSSPAKTGRVRPVKIISILFYLLLIHLPVIHYGQAATVEIKGTVVNKDGEPIQGSSVAVRGSSIGSTTNNEGAFTLSIPTADNVVLEISSVGFITKSVAVGQQRVFNITLDAVVGNLEEVVVVGYGTQSKRKITGSVVEVDMSKTEALPNTNITQALRGTVPGLQFTASGRPGQDGAILIRGQNSLSAANNPLIVLDGIIFNGSLADISPDDIQSMNILKDASSASIYGSRAANGVILITSKKGTSEKPTVKFSSFYGLSDDPNQVKLLSPERYIQRAIDYRIQAGMAADPSQVASYLPLSEAENYKNGITHDPWKMASQQGRIASSHISISGRSKAVNYYLSADVSKENGLIFNDDQKRTSLRLNLSTKITDWFNVGVNAMFSQRDLSGEHASLYDAYRNSPYGTWFYPDGQPTQFPVAEEQASVNPLRNAMLTDNEEKVNNLFTNIFVELKAPFIKGLEYRLNFSPNYIWQHNYNFYRQDIHMPSTNTTWASKFNKENYDWTLENILTYKKSINADHVFDVTLMYGRNHYGFESTTAKADKLNSDVLGYHNLGLGAILTNNSLSEVSEGISTMARLNYQFARKYFLTLTARRDASSVFAANQKHATFPSAAFAWMVSDENFFDFKFIDMLKLRVSYGTVGNQAIRPYQSLSLSSENRYVFGDDGPTSLGIYPSIMGNDDLKWETSYTANVAVDFEMFKGRLGGSLEFYNTNTKDLLVKRSIPTTAGFSNILTNIGQTNNKGFELSLNTVNIRKNKFEWSTNIAFSYNRNKIVHLYRTDINGDGREDDDIVNNWFIGQPITSYFDYIFDGIYQEGDTDIPTGYAPGWVRFVDLNKDGRINASDRSIVGSGGSPRYQLGIKNNVSYGNFTFSVFVNSMFGWKAPFSLLNPLAANGRSINQLDAGWWTKENRSNTRASLVYTNPLRYAWYVSRDFVRIQDVALSYNVPQKLLDKVGISKLSFYLSAKNLHVFTDWLGSDPESGGNYTVGQQASDDIFPMPRSVTVGFNLTF